MMKHYLDLISISSKIHKKQSRMTRICIILAVFLVTVIFGMADMEIRSQKIQAIQSDGGWHAAFKCVDDEQATLIAARPEVKTASWYGAINYGLDMGYTLAGTETVVCGFDESFLKMVPAAEIVEGTFPVENNEAVLTKSVKERLNLQIGDEIRLNMPDGQFLNLIVTGFTGNTSLLTKNDAFGIYMNTQAYRKLLPVDAENYYDSVVYYVEFSPYCKIQRAITDIKEQFGLSSDQIMENTKLLGLMGQSNNSYMIRLYMVAIVLAVLVMTAGVLMIASSLNSNVVQHTQFFGMLCCLGATKKQIIHFVRREALDWCKTSIPIGLVSGTIIIWGLCALLKILSPSYFTGMPTFGISWIGVLSGIIIGIVTVLLAAQSPAKRAAKVSPLTAVSGNGDLAQFTRKAANTRFFKIETALGIHHAKSSKKNFVLMVGSFSFSIILFLAFTSAVDFMNHAIKPLQPYTPDISIVSSKNTCSIPTALEQQLSENLAVKRVYGRMFVYNMPVEINGKEKTINLISYENNQFQWAKDDLLEGNVGTVQNGNGVFTVYDPENPLKIDSTITADFGKGTQKLTIAGILSNCPFDRVAGVETVICSEKTFRQLTGETGYTIIDIQLNRKATDEDVNAIRDLAGTSVTISDQRMGNSEARGGYYSFALFIYGFLVVIALIAIFNIVNSIAMSVSARLRQYGAMRAIGMSDHQVIMMVAAETITYVLFGIGTGCLIGLPINKVLFENLVTFRWGTPWYIPIAPLCTIILVFAFSSVLAICGPAKRIHNMSIVDTISAQ